MKRILIGLTILLFAGLARADGGTVLTVKELPKTVEAFLALRDELAGTPEGGAAIFVTAMLVFEDDKALGETFLTIALDASNLRASKSGYKGYEPGVTYQEHMRRARGGTVFARSYVEGTSPEKGYAAEAPYKMAFTRNKFSEKPNGDVTVFVACSGADSPRPLTMHKNSKGVWKAKEASSLFVGMRKPTKDDGDDL